MSEISACSALLNGDADTEYESISQVNLPRHDIVVCCITHLLLRLGP